MPCVKFSLVGDSQWKAVQESLPPEWTKCGCISGFRTSGVNQLTGWTSTRASQIPPPFALPLRGSSKQKPKQDLSQKNSTHARPNRHDCRGSSQSHLLSMCICFAPCITGVLVLDLTWFEGTRPRGHEGTRVRGHEGTGARGHGGTRYGPGRQEMRSGGGFERESAATSRHAVYRSLV